MPDPIIKTYASQATQHLDRAATSLAARQQVGAGTAQGNVSPWAGSADLDFHGTLAAIWVWARHQVMSGEARFASPREAAWAFIERVWRRFIPEAIGPAAGDEAAFDCALTLRAALAERTLFADDGGRGGLVGGAARLLAAYLAELDDLSGRDFQDPGFLAWNLIEYARVVEDRGLLATGRRFVERAFGMKAPPGFASEAESVGGLFDFSSTTATRVLSVISSEGNTPFVGAWLRERVASVCPEGFVPRTRDENAWNACVAAMLGRAYVVSTDPAFLDSYREVWAELGLRDPDSTGMLAREGDGRSAGAPPPDTLATFFYALAADALVRTDVAATDILAHSARGHRPNG